MEQRLFKRLSGLGYKVTLEPLAAKRIFIVCKWGLKPPPLGGPF